MGEQSRARNSVTERWPDEDFPQIAWRRAGVSDHRFMERWTMQHRAAYNANTTLCGIRIPWGNVGPGDSRRCSRCERALARRCEQ